MDALEGDDEGIGQLKKHALHLCNAHADEAFVENINPNTLRPKPTNVYIHVRHVPLGIQTTHTFHQRVRDTSVEYVPRAYNQVPSPPSNEHHIKKKQPQTTNLRKTVTVIEGLCH